MNCKEFEKLIPLYLGRKFDEIENIEDFEWHAASCEDCIDDFADILAMHNFLADGKDLFLQDNPEFNNLIDKTNSLIKSGMKGEELLNAFEIECKTLKKKIFGETPIDNDTSEIQSLSPLSIIMGGNENVIEWVNDKALIPILSFGKIFIKRNDQIIFKYTLEPVLHLSRKDEKAVLHTQKTDGLEISITKSNNEYFLIIQSKNTK